MQSFSHLILKQIYKKRRKNWDSPCCAADISLDSFMDKKCFQEKMEEINLPWKKRSVDEICLLPNSGNLLQNITMQ